MKIAILGSMGFVEKVLLEKALEKEFPIYDAIYTYFQQELIREQHKDEIEQLDMNIIVIHYKMMFIDLNISVKDKI